MKARVIETGEIVDLRTNHMDEFFTKDGVRFIGLELDFDFDYQPDYWEKLKHQYAGMAMQGLLSNSAYLENFVKYSVEGESLTIVVTANAIDYATAFVNRLKEDSQCEK